tara:strand:+ start:2560 stop:3681 length:1122 start_codon:yes stop_codon:yes gene_type:complete
MKKNLNKEFVSIYKHIYQDKYKYKTNQYLYYKNIIKNNFLESKITKKDISNLITFNSGTGLECVTMQSFGTKYNIFCDISKYPINHLREFIFKKKITNIKVYKKDLCLKKFALNKRVNFIYLNGVLHHLYDDNIAIKNLDKILTNNGKVFFRNYRSGNLRNFTCEIIRKILNFKDKKNFRSTFLKIFKTNSLNKDLRYKNFIPCFYESSYDMFFAPIINYYDSKNFISYFKNKNYCLINRPSLKKYDHANLNNDATAINFIFLKKEKLQKKKFKPTKLKTVDQLKINYKEKIIKKTLLTFKRLDLNKIKNLNSKIRLYYCLKLFYIAEVYRMSKTLKNVPNFENLNKENLNKMNIIHKNLNATLLNLKNEYAK